MAYGTKKGGSTNGAAPDIAVDDLGASGAAQAVKILDGTAGSTTPITGDANGLKVQLGTGLPAGASNIGDVDVLTVPADPFGANADSTVAAGASGSISAKLRRATQGLEDLKTGIVLAAGNNNVGDVDVASLPSGYAKTADYDSGAGTDTVVMHGIAVPKSGGAVAGGTSTDPLRTDPTGTTTQPVSLASVPSHAVTNAGTFAVQDSEKLADNAGFTDGTTKVMPGGYILDETAGTALVENDIGAARIDSKRAQVYVLEDETTRGQRATVTAGKALKVDGSAVTQPVDSELPAAAALADDTTNPTTPLVGAANEGFDGTTWDRLRTTDAFAGNGALTPTGAQAVGIGPGWNRRLNPANLGTVIGNQSAVDVNGAGVVGVEINTTTTGTFTFEVTDDGTTWIAPEAVRDVSGAAWVQGTNLTPTVGKVYTITTHGRRQLRLRTVATLGATVAHVITLDAGNPIVLALVEQPVNTLLAARVAGATAHGSTPGGGSLNYPNPVGGTSIDMDDTAPPNRVGAEANVVRFGTDRDGTQFVHPHGPQVWSYHEDSSVALTDTTVHAAPGAGLSLYVTDIVVSTGAATALNIFFEEGTTTKVLGPYYLEAVAGRTIMIHFGTPKKITANTLLSVTTSAAIAHSIDVTGWVGQG